jgi:hypothetical protein
MDLEINFRSKVVFPFRREDFLHIRWNVWTFPESFLLKVELITDLKWYLRSALIFKSKSKLRKTFLQAKCITGLIRHIELHKRAHEL